MGDGHYPPHEAPAPGAEKVAYHTSVASSPSSEDHPLRLFYMLSFLAARRTLYITTPVLRARTSTRERRWPAAPARAWTCGSCCRTSTTDAMPIRQASHSYYDELLEAGVRIYEYQPAMMHSKMAVVDGLWSVVGSANMDIRSKELNQENVLGILDEGFGGQVQETLPRRHRARAGDPPGGLEAARPLAARQGARLP